MSARTESNLQLDWALYYHRLGWSVVPTHIITGQGCSCEHKTKCISPGKHPAIAWKAYQRERATEDQIRNWFSGAYRGYGVGIITGRASGGLFVVDVDEAPGKPGPETLHDLQMRHDDLPETTQAITGGGGRHYLFIAPPDVIVKTDRNILGPGVDTRGEGGFIVAAPSLHSSGRYYLWDENHHPHKVRPAVAPDWLLELVKIDAFNPGAHGDKEISVNQFGLIVDGREKYMIRVISGCIGSYVRQHGCLPDEEELFNLAWPTYSSKVKARGETLDADGRGEDLCRQRCAHMLRRAKSGAFPVFQTIVDEIANQGIEAGLKGVQPEDVELTPTQQNQETPSEISATPIEEIDFDAIPPRKWLYGYSLVRGFVTVLASPGGVGKTALATVIGLSVALNNQLLDQAPHKAGKIWIYNLEDPPEEMWRRVKGAMIHHKITKEEVKGKVFLDSGRVRRIIVATELPQHNMVATPDVPGLIKEIRGKGIDLLIVDPFVRAHELDENSNKAIDFAMEQFAKIADATGCAVLLIHHFRKGGQGGSADALRGASSMVGAARAVFTLAAMTNEEAESLGVDEEERRRLFRMDDAKLNMAPPAQNTTWFELVGVPIGNATLEYPNGDTVQTAQVWTPTNLWEGISKAAIGAILDQIDAGLENGERYSLRPQDSERYAGGIIVQEAGVTSRQAQMMLNTWVKNGVLAVEDYTSPRQRKRRKGLRVIAANRPTGTTQRRGPADD